MNLRRRWLPTVLVGGLLVAGITPAARTSPSRSAFVRVDQVG